MRVVTANDMNIHGGSRAPRGLRASGDATSPWLLQSTRIAAVTGSLPAPREVRGITQPQPKRAEDQTRIGPAIHCGLSKRQKKKRFPVAAKTPMVTQPCLRQDKFIINVRGLTQVEPLEASAAYSKFLLHKRQIGPRNLKWKAALKS
jgi:hypothetical protein